MSKLQSKNISTLCLELGFGEGFPNRDTKSFTKSITDFRMSFEAIGNHISGASGKSDSEEAKEFALAFCLENGRAEELWPSQVGSSSPDQSRTWPSWLKDRASILSSLAHIFALQAFYKYQRDLKNGKKQTAPQSDKSMEKQTERELSPESMKYVGPLSPYGTRRRPAKPANLPSAQSANAKNAMVDACLAEVLDLDPRNDDRPIIKEFTTQWLTQSTYQFSSAADMRVRTLMHKYDYYPLTSDDNSTSILKFVNPLRKGTEIEGSNIDQYKEFEGRVRQRILWLAQALWLNGFVELGEGGQPQKTNIFRDIWKQRHTYWAPKSRIEKVTLMPIPKGITASTNDDDIYTVPDSDDSIVLELPSLKIKNTMAPPRKVNLAKSRSKSSKTNLKANSIFNKSSSGKNPDEDLYEDNSRPTQKRQKISPTYYLTQPNLNIPSSSALDIESLHEDAEIMPADEEGNAILQIEESSLYSPAVSFNIAENETTPTSHLTDTQNPSNQIRPSTPNSLEDALAAPKHVSPVTVISTSPQPEVKAKSTKPLGGSPCRLDPWSPRNSFGRSSVPSPQPNLQQLSFIIQSSDQKLDMDIRNMLSLDQFRSSNVFEFFDLYSEKANVSSEVLSCLTFTFVFANCQDMVVHRGDVEQWKSLKELTKLLFTLHRKRNRKTTNFRVTIEIGDKTMGTEDAEVEDDMSWGC